jgi:hypothetical protein
MKRWYIDKIKFPIINLLYNNNVFGFNKYCWSDLINYCYDIDGWSGVRECNMCEGCPWTYCGKPCGCDLEHNIPCDLHKDTLWWNNRIKDASGGE